MIEPATQATASPATEEAPAKNKGGRPKGARNKITLELREAAQAYTEEAIDTIVSIMRNSLQEQMKLAAAKEILDRGHGRPMQRVEATGKDGEAIAYTVIKASPHDEKL